MTTHTAERIIEIRYWTPGLVSFRTTRNLAYRFTPGHYARLGIVDANAEIIWRPFSMASAPHEPYLEFFATLVAGGKFSTALSMKQQGETIYIERASYGFMTLDNLAPGSELWLLASGTGLGPFLSIVNDAAAWESFEAIILVHSVRCSNELAYAMVCSKTSAA
jgi:ferredoxin/flavodoxin---NADP+ reductase